MDNKMFYNAIKKVIDYYRKENQNDEGYYMIKTEFKDLEKNAFDEYNEDLDYRKIFLKSYFRRYFDTSPSLDYEGKEINWEERMVADIMFRYLTEQLDNKMEASHYHLSGDINFMEYDELLKEHNLL